jgi:hypothetical protein
MQPSRSAEAWARVMVNRLTFNLILSPSQRSGGSASYAGRFGFCSCIKAQGFTQGRTSPRWAQSTIKLVEMRSPTSCRTLSAAAPS